MVFVMREIEELSVEETADFLGIPQATVKTRLHRAHRLLRQTLDEQLAPGVRGHQRKGNNAHFILAFGIESRQLDRRPAASQSP